MDEFTLIRTYFTRQPVQRADVVLGVGDDAAVLDPPPGAQIVVTTDVLVAGVHFPLDTDPYAIGYKSLAVNLSDLAAMGAEPAWATLDLVLPAVDETWLSGFSRGLFALAERYAVQLVGGDTARGPLCIGIQLQGFVPRGAALTRAGARAGDAIYVTGTLGDAGLGLLHAQGRLDLPDTAARYVRTRLDRPEPRVAEGMALRGIADAAIDISDGLVADLGHILEASGVGARIELAQLPLSAVYSQCFDRVGGWDVALTHGDDYELCFTVPPAREPALAAMAEKLTCGFHRVGVIETDSGLRIIDVEGGRYRPNTGGYNHFHGAEDERH